MTSSHPRRIATHRRILTQVAGLGQDRLPCHGYPAGGSHGSAEVSPGGITGEISWVQNGSGAKKWDRDAYPLVN